MKTIFNISLENDDVQSDLGGDADVSGNSVVDTIIESNVVSEVRQEESSIEQVSETIDNSIEVLGDLREQHSSTQDLLENNPEEVTDEVVAVAQEQFYITLNKLDNLTYYKGSISNELSANTPLEKLKLTHEGIGDMISSVVNGIINAIKKIIEWIRNLISKIGNIFKSKEKKAEYIKTETENIMKEHKPAFDKIGLENAFKKGIESLFSMNDTLANIRELRVEMEKNQEKREEELRNKREEVEKLIRSHYGFIFGYIRADGKIKVMMDYDDKVLKSVIDILKSIENNDYTKIQNILNILSNDSFNKYDKGKDKVSLLSSSLRIIDKQTLEIGNITSTDRDIDFVREQLADVLSTAMLYDLKTIDQIVKNYEHSYKKSLNKIQDNLKSAQKYLEEFKNKDLRDDDNTVWIKRFKSIVVDFNKIYVTNGHKLIDGYLKFAQFVLDNLKSLAFYIII